MIEHREAGERILMGQVVTTDRAGRIVLADAASPRMLGVALVDIAVGEALAWDPDRMCFIDEPPKILARGSIRGAVFADPVYVRPSTWRDRPPML